jgi:hypothetical protein
VNLKAFQVLTGISLIAIFFMVIIVISLKENIVSLFNYLKNQIGNCKKRLNFFRVSQIKERIRKFLSSNDKQQISCSDNTYENSEMETTKSSNFTENNDVRIELNTVKFSTAIGSSSGFFTTNSRTNEYIRTISNKVKRNIFKFKVKYLSRENQSFFYFSIKIFLICWFVLIQIVFLHSDVFEMQIKDFISKSECRFYTSLCHFFDAYLFEDLVYFVVALFIFISIMFTKRNNRFNQYIYDKHKSYLNSTRYHKPIKSNSIQSHKANVSTWNKLFFRKNQFNMSSPSMPFSINNRAATSAIYILYTYDILNILMSVYTDNLNESFMGVLVPSISNFSGVLVDFLFQILQVCLIGVKFYPILIVLDLSSVNLMINMLTVGYVLFIWMNGIINKVVCSKRQGIVQRGLLKLSKNLHEKLTTSLRSKYDMASRILGLINDEPDTSEKYIFQLKTDIPRLFNQQFTQCNFLFPFTSSYNFINLHLIFRSRWSDKQLEF